MSLMASFSDFDVASERFSISTYPTTADRFRFQTEVAISFQAALGASGIAFVRRFLVIHVCTIYSIRKSLICFRCTDTRTRVHPIN